MKQRLKIYVAVALLATCGCVCYDSAVSGLRSRYDDQVVNEQPLSVESAEVVHE